MIVTLALATLLWVYLIAPYAEQPRLSLLAAAASVAYPAMDILLLGVVARVAAGSHRREPAFLFVLAGAVVLLLTDVIYGWMLLGGGHGIGALLDAGWAHLLRAARRRRAAPLDAPAVRARHRDDGA